MGSMELGSVPRPPKKPEVLDEDPVGQGQDDESDEAAEHEPACAR